MLTLWDSSHINKIALPNANDIYVEQTIGTTDTPIYLDKLFFKYPLSEKNASNIQMECYVDTEDAEYVVKERNYTTSKDNTAYLELICDLNIEPLKGTLIDNFVPGSALAENAANLALTGTGWVVGYCDVTKYRTANKTQVTAFEALESIASAYNCEIKFDTIHKYVIIHQKLGADRGTYFTEQLNLTQLQVQGSSRDFITRLYPFGKDGLDISSVNNGQKFVSNYQYSTKIIAAYWIDSRYTVAQNLKDDATERLAYLSSPVNSYSCKITDLARLSTKWTLLDFKLGDTVTLISAQTGLTQKQRIIKIDRYLDEPEKTTIEISNKIKSLDDIILHVSDAADTVSAMTDGNGNVNSSNVVVTNPDGTYSSLTSSVANIGTLIAAKADITELHSNYITANDIAATYATIATLNTDYITADSIKSQYATIDFANVANGTIKNALIADATITGAKIADATIDTANIANAAITAALINDASITNAKIANAAISNAQIQDGTITNAKIANGTITNAKIANATIDTAQIVNGAITTALIANEAVSTSQIADGSITDAKIVELTANKITAGTLSVDRLIITGSTQSIVYTINEANGTAQLSQSTLDGGSLTQRSITADRIVANAITTNEIASNTITSNNIAANTITATSGIIANGAITNAMIQDATIQNAKIAAVDAGKITTGTLDTNRLNVSTLITALNISTDVLIAKKVESSDSGFYGDFGTSQTNSYGTGNGLNLYGSFTYTDPDTHSVVTTTNNYLNISGYGLSDSLGLHLTSQITSPEKITVGTGSGVYGTTYSNFYCSIVDNDVRAIITASNPQYNRMSTIYCNGGSLYDSPYINFNVETQATTVADTIMSLQIDSNSLSLSSTRTSEVTDTVLFVDSGLANLASNSVGVSCGATYLNVGTFNVITSSQVTLTSTTSTSPARHITHGKCIGSGSVYEHLYQSFSCAANTTYHVSFSYRFTSVPSAASWNFIVNSTAPTSTGTNESGAMLNQSYSLSVGTTTYQTASLTFKASVSGTYYIDISLCHLADNVEYDFDFSDIHMYSDNYFGIDEYCNVTSNNTFRVQSDSSHGGYMYYRSDGLHFDTSPAGDIWFNGGGATTHMCNQTYSASDWPTRSTNIIEITNDSGYVEFRGSSFAVGCSSFGSDRRLKQNIVPSTTNACEALAQMQPVQFDWIASGKHQSVGFIAQDMIALSTEYAYGIPQNEDGTDLMYQLDPTTLLPLTMKGVQELHQRVTTLENTVAQLQAAVTALQTK